MKSEWEIMKLGDLCNISSSKRIFAKEYCDKGIPFYRGKEIIEKHKGNVVSTKLFISEERYAEIKERYDVPKIGDILLSSVGTLGVPWLVDEERFYFKDGNLTWLRPRKGLDNKFLYFWLCSPEAKRQIDAKCIGSTQKAITIEVLSKFEIHIPSIDIQRRISDILFAIVNKIGLNKKINDNLQQQAGVVFSKYYDVSADRQPFTSLISVLGGGTPKTGNPDFWDGIIPFFTPKDVGSPYTFQTEKYITELGLEHCNSRLYPKNTSFVTARGTVGKVSLAGKPMAMNQSCYALASNKIDPVLVYFYVLKAVASLKHKASGAVFDAIVTRDFDTEVINVLTEEDSEIVLATISPMMAVIHKNIEENIRLSALRDTLLPKLMSGELDISGLDL